MPLSFYSQSLLFSAHSFCVNCLFFSITIQWFPDIYPQNFCIWPQLAWANFKAMIYYNLFPSERVHFILLVTPIHLIFASSQHQMTIVDCSYFQDFGTVFRIISFFLLLCSCDFDAIDEEWSNFVEGIWVHWFFHQVFPEDFLF